MKTLSVVFTCLILTIPCTADDTLRKMRGQQSAIQRTKVKAHKLSIIQIRVEPKQFKVGEPIHVFIKVANHGKVERNNISVELRVDGQQVETPKSIPTIYPGQVVDIDFPFTIDKRNSETISIFATINLAEKIKPPLNDFPDKSLTSQVSSQESEKSGKEPHETVSKEAQYNYVYDEKGDIGILYKVEPPVHQWISFQAYNKLPSGDLKSELSSYLPTSSTSSYYSSSFSPPGAWSSNPDSFSLSSTALIEGAWEEDKGTVDRPKDHFWDPDSGYDAGLFFILQWDSALQKAQEELWQSAISNYNADNKPQAYYLLGRVSHLLMDMSVPAHTLLDVHIWPYDDQYEEFTADNYKDITSSSSNTNIPAVGSLPSYPQYTPGTYDADMTKLFYNLAEKSDDFDSDDEDGESSQFGQGKYTEAKNDLNPSKTFDYAEYWGLISKIRTLYQNTDYDIFEGCSGVSEYSIYYYRSFYEVINNTVNRVKVFYTDETNESFWNLDEFSDVPDSILECIHQPELQTRSVGYVAALYQLFWDSVEHPDTDPPMPSPMTWATEPYETSTSSISMMATVASDPSTPIYYEFDFFTSPTGGTGGTDSEWQTSTSYTDSGLEANHRYSYRVHAKDSATIPNLTAYSVFSDDYTDIETPSGITFGTITTTSIEAKSSSTPSGLNRGSSGLKIFNTTKGTDSGWNPNNNFWTSSSLSPNMQYEFKAKARNGDADPTGNSPTSYKYTKANPPGVDSFSNVTTNSIQANWTANSNPAGTEYFCENITQGTDSDWITDTYWNSTGLSSATTYAFQVTARNEEDVPTAPTSLGSQKTHWDSITGVVTRDSDGLPIQGLSVRAYNDNGGGLAQTLADGSYAIKNLAAGTYRVQVETYSTDYVEEYYEDSISWGGAYPVTVLTEQTTPDIDFGLAIGGIITGTVTDANGVPMSGLSVNANGYNWYDDGWGYATTDIDGFYEIKRLPAGIYKVDIFAPDSGYISEYYDDEIHYRKADPIEVAHAQIIPNIDFSLDIGGTISGTVINSNGEPVSFKFVGADDHSIGCYNYGFTDSNGYYEIKGLATGTYDVDVDTFDTEYIHEYYDDKINWEEADGVDVVAEQETPNIDFVFEIGGTITGTVTDSNGMPIIPDGYYDVSVNVYDYRYDSFKSFYGQISNTYVNGDGNYEIKGLPTGLYRIRASMGNSDYISEYYNDKICWDNAAPVTAVAGQQTTNIDFSLETGASLSGQVKNSSGIPQNNIRVHLYNKYGLPYSYFASTDGLGEYNVRGLPLGYYTIVALPRDTVHMPTIINVNVPDVDSYIAPDIIFQSGALTVSGMVTDKATGNGIFNIYVSCYLPDTNIHIEGVTTDEDGKYILNTLPPGEMIIRAGLDYYGFGFSPNTHCASMGVEIDLTVDVNDLDFVLPAEAILSGKILDAETAEPLGGIELQYRSEKDEIGQKWFTDINGSFYFTNLPSSIAQIKAKPRVDTGYAWGLPWGSDWVNIDEGEEKLNRLIVLQKGALVSGYVKDPNGDPLDNINYGYTSRLCDGWSLTDVDGHYEIRLPQGTHAIDLEENDFGALCKEVTITDVNQPIDVNDIVAYDNVAGGQISGTVNNPSGYSKAGVFDIIAFEAETVVDSNTWYNVWPVYVGEVILENAGPFEITPLPPDANYDIYLCVESQSSDSIESLAVQDFILNIPIGATSLNLNYNSEGGTLLGCVTNINSSPVLGAYVLLHDSATKDFAGFGQTDPNGEYIIYNVPANTYTVTAVHSKYLNSSTIVQVIDGVSVNSSTIVMAFASEKEAADLNGDGIVGILDVALFANQWLQVGLLEADFNQDNRVNFVDWVRLAENWLWQVIWYND